MSSKHAHYLTLTDLMVRLGIKPPDTDFNRRAAEYAHHAQALHWANETARRNREAKAKETAE